MAEMPSNKRSRDELPASVATQSDDGEAAKRQKPYDDILSLLDEEEDDPQQDLSSLITTLQQELSSSTSSSGSSSPAAGDAKDGPDGGEDERERVMRHLLEASDDELGLPSISESGGESGAETFDGVAPAEGLMGLCDGGLWELEDEAANYYALLQSELFMM
ncbi:uncharacterized protein LOC116211977 [Punica granatum]|uniref:Uncharacterized protein n=2 Tax=Punica granatum TaxID=22663 RepID=A0A218WVD9_PUNGR|nr:uncharacterized protein LOC116211977 [Punica granatum]OWM75952.1 hypothetical protein CDL15_Pgr009597 [Punica granatum]PKI36842.1 hypothetical protein CRG98_042791 [Punica granatum]